MTTDDDSGHRRTHAPYRGLRVLVAAVGLLGLSAGLGVVAPTVDAATPLAPVVAKSNAGAAVVAPTIAPTTPVVHMMTKNNAGISLGRTFEGTFKTETPAQQATVAVAMQAANVGWVRVDVDINSDVNAIVFAQLGFNVEAVFHPQQYGNPTAAAAGFTQVVTTLKQYGIHVYEMGNEPNCPHEDTMSAVGYDTYIKKLYPAGKLADPQSYLLAGAFCPNGPIDEANWPPTYLATMYKYGAAGYFDGLADHPYTYPDHPTDTTTPWNPWNYQSELHDIMAAHGDGAKYIWYDEFGGPTTVAGEGNRLTYQQLANQIQQAFTLDASMPWGGPVLIFNWEDTSLGVFGLHTITGQPKQPAFQAFAQEGLTQADKVFGVPPAK